MEAAILLPLAGGALAGLLGLALRIPGGAVIGALLGASIVQVAILGDPGLPTWVRVVGQVAIGGAIGAKIAPAAMRAILPVMRWAMPMLAGLLLIAVGVGVAYGLYLELPLHVGILATIPGGVAEVMAVALELEEGTAVIAAVHLGRQVLVLFVLTGLLRIALTRYRRGNEEGP